MSTPLVVLELYMSRAVATAHVLLPVLSLAGLHRLSRDDQAPTVAEMPCRLPLACPSLSVALVGSLFDSMRPALDMQLALLP